MSEPVLYCYGECGRRYADFGLDIVLPNKLWNQIAPRPGTDDEGGGGVLCAQCIVDRLAKLPHVTVVFADVDAPAKEPKNEIAALDCTIKGVLVLAHAVNRMPTPKNLELLGKALARYDERFKAEREANLMAGLKSILEDPDLDDADGDSRDEAGMTDTEKRSR